MVSQSTTRRLHIAYVVHDYHRHGGHSRYVAELASRFKRDHEVHVYANTFDEAEPDGLTFHRVPAWRANALASILSFVVPATVGVRGDYDIVHAQGLCGLRHNVATAHFCQPAWHGALAEVNRGLTWKQWLARVLITPLERQALCGRHTRRVIAISERVRADLARHFQREAGVRLIYHGVDLETFHPRNRQRYRDEVRASLGIGPDHCLALFVGNLQKGAAAAIRAVARAFRECGCCWFRARMPRRTGRSRRRPTWSIASSSRRTASRSSGITPPPICSCSRRSTSHTAW